VVKINLGNAVSDNTFLPETESIDKKEVAVANA
jgi:hypothetical protein